MKVAFFDTHRYDRAAFDAANAAFHHQVTYFETRLTSDTASLAAGHEVVCCFVNDHVDRAALSRLHQRSSPLIRRS